MVGQSRFICAQVNLNQRVF
uniref:Uncharacterized protein n=1 Tax=Anguilla anguilla TaxID=7936 RepID=A0A0E9Q3G7_ANGAN